MFIDCSKLPDPADPQLDDVYASPCSTHVLVVTSAPYRDEDAYYMRIVRDGTTNCIQAFDFPAILTSLALRPWGRLDRSSADGRPKISDDPQLVAQRLEAFGPHLRALREQYGLSMGDLSRALGCPPARLSMLELAQPDPVRVGAGVREDEGRAALAELLTNSALKALAGYLPCQPDPDASGKSEEPDPAHVVVWEAIYVMLSTVPARAAMDTIHRAVAAATAATGTGAWEQPDVAHLVDVLLEGMVTATTESDQAGPPDAEEIAGTRAMLLHLLTSPRATAAMRHFLAGPLDGLFRPGDRVVYGVSDTPATVTEVRAASDLPDLCIQYLDTGDDEWVSASECKLQNADVAIETARAGLAHLIANRDYSPGLQGRDTMEARIAETLATPDAQRLIRLHG